MLRRTSFAELDVTSAARLEAGAVVMASRAAEQVIPMTGPLVYSKRAGWEGAGKPPSWESYIYSGTTGGLCGSRWGPI